MNINNKRGRMSNVFENHIRTFSEHFSFQQWRHISSQEVSLTGSLRVEK